MRFWCILSIKTSGIHQKEIGARLHLTPSTITRFLEKLEGKGLISRKVEGKDTYSTVYDDYMQTAGRARGSQYVKVCAVNYSGGI